MTHHQRLAASGSHRVLGDILKGIKRRGEILQVWPVDFIADNCCQVRSEIKRVFPNASMCLDVWHFKQRYLAVVMNGRRTASEYRNKEEQETLLMEMFEKWLRVGVSGQKRLQSGIPSDGSRIEGLHRDLARIQHSVASGLEMVIGLTYDFYHRRNMRNALRKQKPTGFISTTYGSHHIHLVNAITHLWASQSTNQGMEVFGLVDSAHEFSLSGLISMKNDDSSDEGMLTESGMETWGQGGTPDVLTGLGLEIQPVQFFRPLQRAQPTAQAPADWADGRLEDPSAQGFGDGDRATISQVTGDTVQLKGKGTVLVPDLAGEPGTSIEVHSPTFLQPKLIPQKRDLNLRRWGGAAKRSEEVAPASSRFTVRAKGQLAYPSEGSNPSQRGSLLSFFTSVRNRGVATNVTNPGRDMSPMVTAPQPRSVHASHQVKASALSQSLPLPEPNPKQLTRSQLLFQSAAGVDPRALRIGPGEDVAFFLFMEMRLENQWVSYDMTPARWVAATGEFNRRLGEDGRERGLSLVLKHPRALMGKLGEIEGTVADRLYRNDFKSAKGATAFWERHCKGVALPGSNMGDSHSKDKPRKVHICSRCRMIMFTGVKSKNHRKGICNDGVWQVVKPDKDSTPTEDRTPPQWPQPAGIFSKDKFSPLKFLKTLRELYGMVVTDGIGQADLPIEHQAFLGLLSERLKLTPTSITFPLYSHLELSDSVPSQWIDEEDGRRFLHLHCLQDASVL
ncbi:hypothetical protein BC826DRAFT_1110313 [Russula brevipes]|nr:hypothetical protein BC826DRAFT_1110313 [Russula brevipes]